MPDRHVAIGVKYLAALMLALLVPPLKAQSPSQTAEPSEMLLTEAGLLAINTPEGWVRSQGPGLAYFVRQEERAARPRVWIYISSAQTGPQEEAKDAKLYIESDVREFKRRFKRGTVKEEELLLLPKTKAHVPVYTFRSGEQHNTIEQVIYIAEASRVLTLVLSAKESSVFEHSLIAFHDFASSYGGSIIPSADSKQ